MSSASVSVELPEPLLAFAQQRANESGTSLAEWLQAEITERLQMEQDTETFFRVRRERAIPGALQAALDRVPNCPPDPGDELE